MDRYLRVFSSHTEYEEYIREGKLIIPNVSYCENEEEVHYSPYDAEIEYLGTDENSGFGNYIDTNFVITSTTFEIHAGFELNGYVGTVGTYSPNIINDNNSSSAKRTFWIKYGSQINHIGFYHTQQGSAGSGSVGLTYNTKYDIKQIKGAVYLNGTRTKMNNDSGSNLPFGNNSLTLFSKGGTAYAKCKFYYFKIIDNNILLLDMIPVRVGEVGYMYDRITNKLFGNSGTGSFILGSDKEQ